MSEDDEVTKPANYCPVQSLERLEMWFEEVTQPQLRAWIDNFIPKLQFGFVKGSGTEDYGAMLAFKMHCILEARKQGTLLSFDVKGAFDRVWWAVLLEKLEKREMRGRALKFMKNYLCRRFLRVVAQGRTSKKKKLFSNVPQGAKWSTDLFNLDVADMEDKIENGELFSYADDTDVWYESADGEEQKMLAVIQEDLDRLWQWGLKNKTTFGATKTGGL